MTAGRVLPTPYKLFQSRELRLSQAEKRVKLVGGDLFPQHIALCEDSDLGTVTLNLVSDCMLVFTGLLLLVEGLEVFAALSFDRVVAARRVAVGMVLWLRVVGPRGQVRRL